MRPDKPQFWRGGDVNLAMTKITKPNILWKPITNLRAKTLVDVNIDCREMLKGVVKIIQDGVISEVITNRVQKFFIMTPFQSLGFLTLEIPSGFFSFSRKAFNILNKTNNELVDIIYNGDGTKFYVLWNNILNNDNNIFEYILTTPFDVSTAISSEHVLSMGVNANLTNMRFNNDGRKFYVLKDGVNNNIWEYILNIPYDISTAIFTQISLNVSAQDTNPVSMLFNHVGTSLFVLGGATNNIFEYTFTTPFDVSTATFSRSVLNVSAQDTNPRNMRFSNNGLKLFVLGGATNNIFEYILTTPFDISTAILSQNFLNVGAETTNPVSMLFNNDKERLFVLENNISANSGIFEYLAPTIWTGNIKIRTLTN